MAIYWNNGVLRIRSLIRNRTLEISPMVFVPLIAVIISNDLPNVPCKFYKREIHDVNRGLKGYTHEQEGEDCESLDC